MPGHDHDPGRFYTVTGGRSRVRENALDLATMITSATDPAPGMPSEWAHILRLCRRPLAVAEIAARLRLPVAVVKILLSDLLDAHRVTARRPTTGPPDDAIPDPELLRKVLSGLRRL
ncbi:DUF742 domain-containing protein [Saccharopolyspora sp. CA-218241]|uniref:DUF742 domain-containing protein n=1 Tax=Saccharopolyspora sp. CA-218241 TaxID=3240027 RepID=UPI003D967647